VCGKKEVAEGGKLQSPEKRGAAVAGTEKGEGGKEGRSRKKKSKKGAFLAGGEGRGGGGGHWEENGEERTPCGLK